jgi:hypothetical protein
VLQIALASLKRVFSDVFAWAGALSTALGLGSDVLRTRLLVPSWVWWAAAVLLLFLTAVRAQWELHRERDKSRAPQPDLTLAELLERLAGSRDPMAAPQKISDALLCIRDKARLGLLAVWGRKDANMGHLEFYPLEPIPAEHWTPAHIDYLQYLGDERCKTSDAQIPGAAAHYADLHFDSVEIARAWPMARRRFAWLPKLRRGTC